MPPKRNTQARTHQSGPHPSEANSSSHACNPNPPIPNPNSNSDPITHHLHEFATLLTTQIQEHITQAFKLIPIISSPRRRPTPIHKPTPINYYVEDTPPTQNSNANYASPLNTRKEHSHQPTRIVITVTSQHNRCIILTLTEKRKDKTLT